MVIKKWNKNWQIDWPSQSTYILFNYLHRDLKPPTPDNLLEKFTEMNEGVKQSSATAE